MTTRANATTTAKHPLTELGAWYTEQTNLAVSPQTTGRLYKIGDWLRRHRLRPEQAQLVVSASDRWGTAKARGKRINAHSERIGATKKEDGRTFFVWIAPLDTERPKREQRKRRKVAA